jgi:hypothetical protein
MGEGKIPHNDREQDFLELALKVSGAVQAARWTRLADGTGFIHSFNGPHSLFVDTIRSCRALGVAHQLGHVLMAEQDARISLLQRLVEHTLNTARYNVYYGAGRDAYDVRGRTAHEAVFNTASGVFRCPNSQQGYSPFSTWTRGQAWAICGFAEQLEFIATLRERKIDLFPEGAVVPSELTDFLGIGVEEVMSDAAAGGNAGPIEAAVLKTFLKAALATADHFLAHCCADGIPMWDTGAPNLHRLPTDYLSRRSDPFNAWEPVDSSAAAIAAQGLWRIGKYLSTASPGPHTAPVAGDAARYQLAALTIARTLFAEPYLSADSRHQGLILHSVYHRPNGWDYIAPGQKVPNGESSMWGDYHARELALLLLREAQGEPYLTFFG